MQRILSKPEIRYSFEKFISPYGEARKFIEKLEENAEVILFGGAVRSYFENKYAEKPRDIDLVLNLNEGISLSNLLDEYGITYRKNKFGGYKTIINTLKFDVWAIDNTWAFKENKVTFKNIQDLNKTVFLNIDAIFYNLTTEYLYNDGYEDAKNERELDIILKDNPQPEINIMRARYFQKKYGLSFTKNLNDYLNDWLSHYDSKEEAFRRLDYLELKRYGSRLPSGSSQVPWNTQENCATKHFVNT